MQKLVIKSHGLELEIENNHIFRDGKLTDATKETLDQLVDKFLSSKAPCDTKMLKKNN